MKHKSKATKFLEYVERNPGLKYGQLQQFFFKLNYPNRSVQEMSGGYYCTNIQHFIYKGHIEKDKNKRYSLTKTGKKYQQTPYAKTEEEVIRAEAVEKYIKRNDGFNEYLLKRATERGHITTAGELIALLKEFPSYFKINVAIDPEINAIGPIASQVCWIDENKTEITLFPTHTRPV
jgi:hypothetical protein